MRVGSAATQIKSDSSPIRGTVGAALLLSFPLATKMFQFARLSLA